jgi:hypothetical protein
VGNICGNVVEIALLHQTLFVADFQKRSYFRLRVKQYPVATSVAPAPPFSGSGNIAIITFNVTSPGHSVLDLTTELADYNPSGSSFIDHSDIKGTVDSVIPEFPNIAVFALFVILATIAVVISKKLLKKNLAQTTILTNNS